MDNTEKLYLYSEIRLIQKMNRVLLALFAISILLFVSGCKPSDECECTYMLIDNPKTQVYELGEFASCTEMEVSMEEMLGRDVTCF